LGLIGYLESVENGLVYGWAFDEDDPERRLAVNISIDDRQVLIADADEYRADLAAAGIGDGFHAFRVALPASLIRSGCLISATVGMANQPLSDSPRHLDLLQPAPPPPAPPPPAEKSRELPDPAELQQRLVKGMVEWGRSAFDALPSFIDAALDPSAPGTRPRIAGSLAELVKEICANHPPFELPFVAEPVASIIVPAYNQFELTYDCIRSILDTGAAQIAEVILADDTSNDAIVMAGALIANLRISRNRENLGFLRNCNHAARMARGRILVYLNNDTIVKPGWLQALLRTFDDFPRAGVVGSRLIYPDGAQQEAGGIIWADGSAWNFGLNRDGKAPEFNYVRQVDYVSGASLAIRRELFDAFGGFDEHYLPAYCEDSDLCLKTTKAGWKVLYQPFSEVIHFEGKSHGTDIKAGIKAHQVTNSAKLFARWKADIAGNGANAEKPLINKDRGWIGRALVIDMLTPTPDRDAGSVATFEQMLILRDLGYKISFIPEDNFADVGEPTRRLQAAGIECVYGPYICSVQEWLEKFGKTVDIVHVYRPNVLSRHINDIRRYAPQARLIYSNADMHHIRMLRQAEIAGNDALRREAEVVRKVELDLHRRADCSIVVSDFEVELLAEAAPEARVRLLRWITEVAERSPEWEGRDAIAFLGGYQHSPNVDAVDYFVTEIWPSVAAAVPEARFLICGSSMPDRFKEYAGPNVEVVGYVPDLAALFRRCIATVAPLRYGAGLKGKVATSLSYGVPAIGTSIAIEGMGLGMNDGMIVAETADDYARSIRSLYRNPRSWANLSQAGIAAVDRLYSRKAATKVWIDILSDGDNQSARLPARSKNPADLVTAPG
jgi:GT2 family glycosyltransferase/glycosyltransferase involved in cell wall biosynthesis